MKVYKDYEIPAKPATTGKQFVCRSCDICGFKTRCDENWRNQIYDFDETEITVSINSKSGSRYPDSGSSREIEVDLCPICFKTKLVPWLKSQGVAIKEEDCYW